MLLHVREPQHKTNGRERVREGQILRNKGDSGGGQSESNGEEIWIGVVVEDKVTKRAHKQKKAQVGKRFHEGGRL